MNNYTSLQIRAAFAIRFATCSCTVFAVCWYIEKDFMASKLTHGLRPSPFADLRSCSCLAFAKLSTRKKEAHTSKLAWRSSTQLRNAARIRFATSRCMAFAIYSSHKKATHASKLAS